MFIYSLRASTIKFVGVVCVALVALITLIAFIPPYSSQNMIPSSVETNSYNFEKVKSNEDRIEFLKQFGWEVEAEPLESDSVVIPDEFDKIFAGYNEIQKQQGLDLSKYKGKTVNRYTYIITNYPNYQGKVYANVLVFRNKVIGGDVCSADMNGFLHGFEKNNTSSQ